MRKKLYSGYFGHLIRKASKTAPNAKVSHSRKAIWSIMRHRDQQWHDGSLPGGIYP